MFTKKIGIVAMAGLMVLALSAVNAEAGVGGCRLLGRCGSYENANTTVKQSPERPDRFSFLDALSWVLPSDVVAAGKAIIDGDKGRKDTDVTIEGVGGCRLIGCGTGSGQ